MITVLGVLHYFQIHLALQIQNIVCENTCHIIIALALNEEVKGQIWRNFDRQI